MPNAGYPDNDGSRSPSGDHDEGRQRQSLYDCEAFVKPAVVAEMATGGDRINNQADSTGNVFLAKPRYPVDGNSNTDPDDYNPAAYPSYTSSA